jgi:CHD5-like protein
MECYGATVLRFLQLYLDTQVKLSELYVILWLEIFPASPNIQTSMCTYYLTHGLRIQTSKRTLLTCSSPWDHRARAPRSNDHADPPLDNLPTPTHHPPNQHHRRLDHQRPSKTTLPPHLPCPSDPHTPYPALSPLLPFHFPLLIKPITTAHPSPLQKQLWILYTSLPFTSSKTKARHKQKTLRREVVQLKREMAATSAQDNFSKWAKIRRKHDSTLQKHDEIGRLLLPLMHNQRNHQSASICLHYKDLLVGFRGLIYVGFLLRSSCGE